MSWYSEYNMTSWSYSHYSLALQCLRKYKLVCVDKLEPEGLESSDLGFGTALHAGINDVLAGVDAISTFTLHWQALEGTMSYTRYNHEALGSMGVEFLRKFEKLHAKKYIVQKAEQRIYSSYKGVKIEGTPDFIGLYEGRPSLRDYKTSSTNYAKEKIPSSLQLNLYAYLAQKELGFTPETLGYDVFNKGLGSIQHLTRDFSEKIMLTHLHAMLDYIEMMDKQKTYPKNVNNCMAYNKPCDFFNICFPKEEK